MVGLYAECDVCGKRFSGKNMGMKEMLDLAGAHEEKPISGNDVPLGYVFTYEKGYGIVEGLSLPTNEHVQRYAIAIILPKCLDLILPYIPDSFRRDNSFESDDVKLSRKVSDVEFASRKDRLEFLVNEDIRFMLKEKGEYLKGRAIQFILKEGRLGLTNKISHP